MVIFFSGHIPYVSFGKKTMRLMDALDVKSVEEYVKERGQTSGDIRTAPSLDRIHITFQNGDAVVLENCTNDFFIRAFSDVALTKYVKPRSLWGRILWKLGLGE